MIQNLRRSIEAGVHPHHHVVEELGRIGLQDGELRKDVLQKEAIGIDGVAALNRECAQSLDLLVEQ